jgi:hypothetical protein
MALGVEVFEIGADFGHDGRSNLYEAWPTPSVA